MKRWAAVCRLGGIGDNLIAASVCAPLKRQGYMVEVITSDSNHAVFLNNPHIDKLSIKNAARDMPSDAVQWQKYLESRANEYDVFVHLTHSCEGRHAVFQNMTAWWWPDDYRRELCAGSYLETAHKIAGVGPPFEFGPLYYATEEEIERALETKQKIMGDAKCVTWVLSGSRIDKVYPYCAFAVSRLIKELGVHVVMMGASPKEFKMAETIQEHVKVAHSDLQGLHLALSPSTSDPGGIYNWPVRRSLAFAIHASDVVVTPDTGIGWAAALEPVPKIVLISHASAENVTKHWLNTVTLTADPERVSCWPCHKLHDGPETCRANKENNGAACISDISVQTIMQNVRLALAQTKDNVVPLNPPKMYAHFGGNEFGWAQ